MWTCSLLETRNDGCHALDVSRGCGSDHPIHIKVDNRTIRLCSGQGLDAVTNPSNVCYERFTIVSDQVRGVDQAMREDIDLLEDHLVDIGVAIFSSLRVYWDAFQRPRQVPLLLYGTGHQVVSGDM